jgi:hypothetical protein
MTAPTAVPRTRSSRARVALRVSGAVLVILLSVAAGILIDHFYIWPMPLITRLYTRESLEQNALMAESEMRGLVAFDSTATVRVRTPQQVVDRRKALADFIWPGKGFPLGRMPDEIDRNPKDTTFIGMQELARRTRMVTRMRAGLNSASYFLEPQTSAGCLMIVWGGHNETFKKLEPRIAPFIKSGCAVITGLMPLTGQAPIYVDSQFGHVRLSHWGLGILERPDFSPISFFVEPVAASLNFVLRDHQYERVGMSGLSGGAWTTHLYAALDERVRRSYPVAGSEPFALLVRRRTLPWADYEQTLVPMYRVATQIEQYVMAASSGRSQLQILNRYDDCCYYGTGYRSYEPVVVEAAAKIGGRFRVFLDELPRLHSISPVAMDTILADFLRSSSQRVGQR